MAKELNIQEASICETTLQMLEKAKRDGVQTCFDRANDMSACPIGAKSACCKNCSMGPCRLSPKDPYAKKGVCGATIDTIQARNFARMVVGGAAAHTDHGMALLDLFKEVVQGKITDYRIKDVDKLKYVCSEIDIPITVEVDGEVKDRDVKELALELAEELEKTYIQLEGEIPFMKRCQTLHDTLDINTHGINSPGDNNRFSGKEVTDMGYPMTHHHFGPGTAHAAQDDTLGAGSLGFFDILRVVAGVDHRFKQAGLMAVNDNVDRFFIQATHIRHGMNSFRSPVENIRQLGGHHGTAPTIGQCRALELLGNIMVFLINPDMGMVHHFHNFTHGPTGNNAQFPPILQGFFRHPLHKRNFPFQLNVGFFQFFSQFQGRSDDASWDTPYR